MIKKERKKWSTPNLENSKYKRKLANQKATITNYIKNIQRIDHIPSLIVETWRTTSKINKVEIRGEKDKVIIKHR